MGSEMCIRDRAGLFACGDEATNRFSLGLSTDEGVTFTPVLHFTDLHPRSCNPGATAEICLEAWPNLAPILGIDAGATGTVPDSGAPPTSDDVAKRSGCSCRLDARPSERAWAAAAWWLAAWFVGRRRRNTR